MSFLVRMLIHILAIGCGANHALRYGLANYTFSDSRDLEGCKGQGRGNAWLRSVIGDETLRQHLATPAQ